MTAQVRRADERGGPGAIPSYGTGLPVAAIPVVIVVVIVIAIAIAIVSDNPDDDGREGQPENPAEEHVRFLSFRYDARQPLPSSNTVCRMGLLCQHWSAPPSADRVIGMGDPE